MMSCPSNGGFRPHLLAHFARSNGCLGVSVKPSSVCLAPTGISLHGFPSVFPHHRISVNIFLDARIIAHLPWTVNRYFYEFSVKGESVRGVWKGETVAF